MPAFSSGGTGWLCLATALRRRSPAEPGVRGDCGPGDELPARISVNTNRNAATTDCRRRISATVQLSAHGFVPKSSLRMPISNLRSYAGSSSFFGALLDAKPQFVAIVSLSGSCCARTRRMAAFNWCMTGSSADTISALSKCSSVLRRAATSSGKCRFWRMSNRIRLPNLSWSHPSGKHCRQE
jgi:hypothetical protein